jgi:hypothetical protein
MAVQTTIKVRRDTATNWSGTNPTLAAGEFGFDTTNKRLKVGDGSLAWNSLGFLKAATATTLETARLINNVSFDGSADITVTADATTLTGTTLKSTVVNSSLTKVGALSSGTAGFVKVDASGNLTSDGTTYLASTTIGSTVQGYDADLQAIGALTATAGYLKKTAANTWTLANETYLLAGAIGSTVQAWDTDLDSIAALTGTNGYLKKTSGVWGLDTTTVLGSGSIGTTVQAWDADLDAIAALAGTTGLLSKTAANTWALDTNSYVQSTGLNGYTTYVGTTAITLARASANLALTGITAVTFPGSTSGSVQLKAAAVAGTGTVATLPATTGTLITTGDTGTVTDGMLAGSITKTKITGTAVTVADTGTVTDAMLAGSITKTKITGTAVTVADTGTVTNTMLAGSIAVSKLLSSSVTIGNSTATLGGSALTNITGLGSLTVVSNGTGNIPLHITGNASQLAPYLSVFTNGGATLFQINSSGSASFGSDVSATNGVITGGSFVGTGLTLSYTGGTIEFYGNSTTAGTGTITNAPGVYSGRASASYFCSITASLATTTTSSPGMEYYVTSNTSTAAYLQTFTSTGGVRGSISLTSSGVTFSTVSDYRLKENVEPLTGGIARLKQLKPSTFNFIGADTDHEGFLAHELQEVVPIAVTGTKDGVDEDNNPDYQGVDLGKVVPLLTVALQEAVAKIESLETRIAVLEGR